MPRRSGGQSLISVPGSSRRAFSLERGPKIVQEGSGPLIHLKRGIGGLSGGLKGGCGYFERGEPCGTAMRALVNKCPVDHLNIVLLSPRPLP